MREDLTKQLFEECPMLYRGKDLSVRQNLMCFGFEFRDGWFNIIRDLSLKLEREIEELKKNGVADDALPMAVQSKEKYGELCLYMTTATDKMYDMIKEAVKKSCETCEECGKPGKIRDHRHWIITLCEKCNEEREKKYEGISKKESKEK